MPGFRNESVGEIKVDTKGSTVSTNNINFSALENLNVMNENIISPGEAETIDFSAIMPNDGDVNVVPTDPRIASGDPNSGSRELRDPSNWDFMYDDKKPPVGIPDPPTDARKRMDEEARKVFEKLGGGRKDDGPVNLVPDLPPEMREAEDERMKELFDELNNKRKPVGIPDPPSDVRKRMDEDARRALEDLNKRRNGENPVPVPDPIGEDRKRMEEQERRALEDLRNARNSGSFEGGHGGGGGGGESW